MKIEVDVSEVHSLTGEAKDLLETVHIVMRSVLDNAAANERAQHEYRNRTGRLQKSTKAATVSRKLSEQVVDLEMGMEYASYVARRGLSEIDAQAKIAERDIESALEERAKRLEK